MTWKFVDEMDVGHEGEVFNADGSRTYTKQYLVETDVKEAGVVAVGNTPGLPLFWSPYVSKTGVEFDLRALLVKRSPKQDGTDWSRWIVTDTYSTELPDGIGGPPDDASTGGGSGGPGGSGGSQNNPDMEAPTREWDYEDVSVAPWVDLDGKKFVNAAGDPFTPAFTETYCRRILRMTRNELGYSKTAAEKFDYTVNSAAFLGHPAGCVLLLPTKATQANKGSLAYDKVTYVFKFGYKVNYGGGEVYESFQPKLNNVGWRAYKTPLLTRPPEEKPSPIWEPDETQPRTPKFLTDDGLVTTSASLAFINFRTKRTADFTSLLVRGLV